METAKEVIAEVDADFAKQFGRSYGGLVDTYQVEDADVVLVMMGSMCLTARFAVDVMRRSGRKVGLLKVRSYRPFPHEKIAEVIDESAASAVVVLDRMNANALRDEVRSALYPLEKRPLVVGYICGLNGRDVSPYNMIDFSEQAFAALEKGKVEDDQIMYMVRKREAA